VAQYKDVVLLSIGEVRVYRPPTMKINRMVSAKYKYPPQPTSTLEMYRGKGQPKEAETILLVEGPEFDAWRGECDAIDQARFVEINDCNYLFALKDVVVPHSFDADVDFGDFARMVDETWQPRDGKRGRTLDYLEWIVLGIGDDIITVGDAMDELLGISQEVVDDVKESFPGDVEGAAA